MEYDPNSEDGATPASERMAVLRLLERGKITPAEATELLRALRTEPPLREGDSAGSADWVEHAARRAAERAQRMALRGRRTAEYWARHADEVATRAAEQATRAAEQIGENVGRVFANLPDFMERAARAGWGSWGPGYRFEDTAEAELEGDGGPAGLDLEGWNGPIRLHPSEDGRVRLVLRKSVHGPNEDEARRIAMTITAVIHGRQVTVRRDEDAPTWPGGLAIEAHLPSTAVWGGVVRTANGTIEVDRLTLRGLRLETSNGRVALSACGGEDVAIHTSNGRIDAEGLRGKAELRTSNGAISLCPHPADGMSEVSAVTSNGPIEVQVPQGLAVDLAATTSNGRIDASALGTEVPSANGTGRTELQWRSPNWDVAAGQVKMILRTTNGAIRFR